MVVGIAVLDQGTKAWAWRHAPGVCINYGGDILVPASFGELYTHPLTGALLDLFDSVLLITAVSLFVRRRRAPMVLISGSMIVGGWTSNLLDRLFMHYWTAPGSVRGVVDFLPLSQRRYDVADIFIVIGTPLFVLATSVPLLRRFVLNKPPIIGQLAPETHPSRRAHKLMVALAVQAVLTAVVGVGAANFGGATAPITSATTLDEPTVVTRHGLFYALPG
jgi:lipoprotein signal peptidase